MLNKRKWKKSEIQKELKSIYQDADGEMPDLQNLDKTTEVSSTKILIRLVGILCVISAVAWSGFFLWTHGLLQEKELLTTSIEGPLHVRSGEEVAYTISYVNEGKTQIASLDIKVNFPLGFEITTIAPEPQEGSTWNVGALSKLSDGAIKVKGIFRAEVGSTQALQALFTYRPGNFSSDFQKIETTKISIDESALGISIDGPEKAVAGDRVEYIVNVQNDSLQVAQNVAVRLWLPKDFSVTKTQPQADAADVLGWHIDSMQPGELFALTVEGTYTSTATDEQSVKTAVLFEADDGVTLMQTQAETFTDVLGGNVVFHLIVDGSNTSQSATPGETLLVSVDYENTSDEVIGNLRLALEATTPDALAFPFDAKKIDFTIPTVARLAPKESGNVNISIPLFESIDHSKQSDRFTLTLTGTFDKVGAIEGKHEMESSPIVITLNSDVSATAAAQFFNEDGDEVGLGPLPPQVGKTTEYEIVWTINNSLHPLSGVLMSTKLPQDVLWKNSVSTDLGTLSYDESTRVINWFIGTLPTDAKQVEARWKVAITPLSQDVGAFFKLANTVTLEAIDTVTNERLTRAMESVTSELIGDSGATGKGIVIEGD